MLGGCSEGRGAGPRRGFRTGSRGGGRGRFWFLARVRFLGRVRFLATARFLARARGRGWDGRQGRFLDRGQARVRIRGPTQGRWAFPALFRARLLARLLIQVLAQCRALPPRTPVWQRGRAPGWGNPPLPMPLCPRIPGRGQAVRCRRGVRQGSRRRVSSTNVLGSARRRAGLVRRGARTRGRPRAGIPGLPARCPGRRGPRRRRCGRCTAPRCPAR